MAALCGLAGCGDGPASPPPGAMGQNEAEALAEAEAMLSEQRMAEEPEAPDPAVTAPADP